MLTSSVFHGLEGNFGLWHSTQNSALARKRRMLIVSAEFGGKQSHEIRPRLFGADDVIRVGSN